MDGWIDGWIDGWMDGLDGWIDGWMDGLMDGWIDGWMDGWIGCSDLLLMLRFHVAFILCYQFYRFDLLSSHNKSLRAYDSGY